MRNVAASNVFGAIALACLLVGITMLFGLWWAVLVAAPVFGWVAYVAYLAELHTKRAKAAAATAALEQAVADRTRR